MRKYATYISELDELLAKMSWGRRPYSEIEMHHHLNDGAASNLRHLVSRSQIRGAGAFFTGEDLGRRLVQRLPATVSSSSLAWDPTCGAGDLLLRWSERLPVLEDLPATLTLWADQVSGLDLHPEFISVAKRRLILSAINRGASLKKGNLRNIDEWFPNVRQGNMLKRTERVPESSVVLMNPPFTMISTPKGCEKWSSGKVSFAAVSLFRNLSNAEEGQRVLAILPDVLRSGSRYSHWRKIIGETVKSAAIEIIGRFSPHADIDVFVFDGIVGSSANQSINWHGTVENNSKSTLDTFCHVSVGAVVPHRHIPSGAVVRYLRTNEAVPWSEINSIKARIRFNGTTVDGPFVAVRRTSSPSDSSRALSTIIDIQQPVAVENHLIAVRPHDGTVETCRRVAEHFKSPAARKWLDMRIRCRHLTVSCIKQMPIPTNI